MFEKIGETDTNIYIYIYIIYNTIKYKNKYKYNILYIYIFKVPRTCKYMQIPPKKVKVPKHIFGGDWRV